MESGAGELDAQALSDLTGCGWLIPDGFGDARITAVPSLTM